MECFVRNLKVVEWCVIERPREGVDAQTSYAEYNSALSAVIEGVGRGSLIEVIGFNSADEGERFVLGLVAAPTRGSGR